MISPLLFLDTETTGLTPDDHIWEIAATLRLPDGSQIAYHEFVQHDQAKAETLPEPFLTDYRTRYRPERALPWRRVDLASIVSVHCGRGNPPYVVGATPSFDTGRLEKLFQVQGVAIPWHHHLIDVSDLAAGYLGVRPPYDHDALSRAVGVDPGIFARHTAAGDVLWTIAMYDAVIRPAGVAEGCFRLVHTPLDCIDDGDRTEGIMRWFDHRHLPSRLALVGRPFQELAHTLLDYVDDGPETAVALRKLLEAKDAAVRAAILTQEDSGDSEAGT